ncbi:MAG: hypothetical protein V1684_02975 [bacterium]
MLDKLFGSKLRLKLVALLLVKPEKAWALPELAKAVTAKAVALAKELKILEKLGLINQSGDKPCLTAGRRWRVNPDFIIYPELRTLVLKGQILLERKLVQKIGKMGDLKLLLLTGKFVGLPTLPTDIFIVGKIKRDQLSRLIRKYERELSNEINYTIMSYQEFKYRRDITDHFLYDILESKHLTLVNKL